MKGQYLAVETVLTFGLGLIAASGIVTVLNTYSDGVYETASGVEARIIQERVLDNMNALRPVKGEASRDIDLPDKVSNRDYVVEGEDALVVDVDGNEFSASIPAQDNLSGYGTGDIRLVKTSEGFTIVDR